MNYEEGKQIMRDGDCKVIMRKVIWWDKPGTGVVLNLTYKKIKKYGWFGYIPPTGRKVIMEKEFSLPFIPFEDLELCKVKKYPERVGNIRWTKDKFIVRSQNYSNMDTLKELEDEVNLYIEAGWTVAEDYDPWNREES